MTLADLEVVQPDDDPASLLETNDERSNHSTG